LTAFQAETAENFREVKAEVVDIRRVVLMERVRAIEKHLGIESRRAA